MAHHTAFVRHNAHCSQYNITISINKIGNHKNVTIYTKNIKNEKHYGMQLLAKKILEMFRFENG